MRDFVLTCRGEWPKTSMCPLVGYNNPSSNFTVVDLPEPFGPSKPNTSPRRTSKLALSTARALGRFQKSLKTLVRPRTDTTTSLADCGLRIADCGLDSVAVICSNSRLGRLAKDFGQVRFRLLFLCHVNHCRIELPFWRLGVNSIARQEHHGPSHRSPLVSVHERLRLCEMKGVGSGDIEQVTASVMKSVCSRGQG